MPTNATNVTRLAPASNVERIAEILELKIASGELPPGSKIGEEQAAASVSSSRGALREALRILEGRGLVVRMPHAGVRVVELSRDDVRHLYGLRQTLESAACRLAAECFTEQDMSELDALLDRHEQRPQFKSGHDYRQSFGDDDFHYRIANRCGNPYLTRLLCHELYSLTRLVRFHFSATPGRPVDALAEHRAIANAIRRRDGELAALLMDRHLSWAIQLIEQAEEPWFLPSNKPETKTETEFG